MEPSMVEARFALGSVSVEEVNEVLREVASELNDPRSEVVSDAPADIDLGSVGALEASEIAEGDGGVTLAILIWVAGYAGGKVLDYLIDDVVRPRLRRRFGGRDVGPRTPGDPS